MKYASKKQRKQERKFRKKYGHFAQEICADCSLATITRMGNLGKVECSEFHLDDLDYDNGVCPHKKPGKATFKIEEDTQCQQESKEDIAPPPNT